MWMYLDVFGQVICKNKKNYELMIMSVYAPCFCGSGKKFKFCCNAIQKKGGEIPATATLDFCKYPIYECKVSKNWKENGMSPVFVLREITKDSFIFMSYLV